MTQLKNFARITSLINQYKIDNQTGVVDWSQRKKEADAIEQEITQLQLRDVSDSDWIAFILKSCQRADDVQRGPIDSGFFSMLESIPGVVGMRYLNKPSNFVELLHVITDMILCEMPPESLTSVVEQVKAELLVAKKKYDDLIAESKNEKLIHDQEEKIYESLYRLVHLGDARPLIDYTSMAKLKERFPTTWYNYSNTSIHVPKVLRRGPDDSLFRDDYVKTHGPKPPNEIKPENKIPQWISDKFESKSEDSRSSEPFAGLTVEDVQPITSLFTIYSRHKSQGTDAVGKMDEVNRLMNTITKYATDKASLHEWLELIIKLGNDAHTAQMNAYIKTDFTPVLSVVRLELITLLESKVGKPWTDLVQIERDKYAKLKQEESSQRWRSEPVEVIQKTEKKQREQMYRLVWLGQVDLLRKLGISGIKALFPEKDTSLAKMMTLTTPTIFGYIYTLDLQPAGLKEDEQLCRYIPPCLQRNFIQIWKKQNEADLNSSQEKIAKFNKADQDIQEVETRLAEFEKSEAYQKLFEHRNRSAKELNILDITFDSVNKLSEEITQIRDRYVGLNNQISVLEIKSNLPERLQIYSEKANALHAIIQAVIENLRNAATIEQQQKASLETKKIEEINLKVASLNELISRLEGTHQVTIAAKDMDASDLEAGNIETSALLTEVGAVETGPLLKEIKKLIAEMGGDQGKLLTAIQLDPQLKRLEEMKAVAAKIDATLAAARALNKEEVVSEQRPSDLQLVSSSSTTAAVNMLLQEQSVPEEKSVEPVQPPVVVHANSSGGQWSGASNKKLKNFCKEYCELKGVTDPQMIAMIHKDWVRLQAKDTSFIAKKLKKYEEMKSASQALARSPSPHRELSS